MKNLFTLILVCSLFSASAQYSASLQKAKDKNNICAERGHNITYSKTAAIRAPYTIDTKDSTVTVYPAPNSGKGRCSRCGTEVENNDKDTRITTWRRVGKAVNTDNTNWGYNEQRSLIKPFKTASLSDVKKVATLRNDTLFIHKRIAPFTSIKEQVTSTTTLYYNNKPVTFKVAVYDEAAFYSGKNGFEIF